MNDLFIVVKLDKNGREIQTLGHYSRHEDAVVAAKDLLSEIDWKTDTVKVTQDAPVYKIVRYVRYVKPE